MPVYNGGRYLPAAIESILGQTLTDFELIIVDDGSEDASQDVVGSYEDERVRLIVQPHLGLVPALNRGLAEARGAFLARMDADDESLPQRLARQVELLAEKASVALVCPSFRILDAEGAELERVMLPLGNRELRACLLLRNPFSHGAVMLRRAAVVDVGGYTADYGNNEDYELWRRLARRYELAGLPDVLYSYREHDLGVSKTSAGARIQDRERLRDELWLELAPSYRVSSVLRALKACRSEADDDGLQRRSALLDDQWALAREALLRRKLWLALRALAVAMALQPRGVRRLARRLLAMRASETR
jgi:glycosyltransferase involved in cell wall biosynthesis